MNIDRIAQLLRPFAELSEEQMERTSAYLDLLVRWNTRVNLTAVRDPEQVVTRHFGESFFAARHLLAPDSSGTAIDVGSGAGFPGVPLAIFAPTAQVTLIESQGKKAAFLNEAIRTLSLGNCRVFPGRAETFPDKSTLVTMRAVEKFDRSFPAALVLVEQGGRIGLMIGISQLRETERLAPQVEWEQPKEVPQSSARVLLVGKVTGPRT
jgi:16S rRNA (guanine527-N7)-methyltransferase